MLTAVRFALRSLAKTPGTALLAPAMIALGIGASTASFSFVHAFFLRPPPFKEPAQLVSLHTVEERNRTLMALSYPNFVDYRRNNAVFAGLALHLSFGARYVEQGRNQYLFGQLVSGGYFALLGIDAALGRVLAPSDDAENAAPVAVVSHNFWLTRLGGARDAVGRTLVLEGQPFTVVGVAPPGFKGINLFDTPDFWIPAATHPLVLRGQSMAYFQSRRAVTVSAVGRLNAGVTIRQAEEAMRPVAADLAAAYPADNAGRTLRLVPVTQAMINPNLRAGMLKAGNLLLALSGLVLLVACANLANLLLTRTGARRREIALRAALGATRGQIVRQLLVEHVLLALAGGAAGLLLAGWIRDLLWALRPPGFPGDQVAAGLDGRVLLFGLAATLVTGLLFGLLPALAAARFDLVSVLKREPQGGSLPLFSFRHLLVVTQVALSVVALIVAGLFVRSLQRASTVQLGWNAQNLVLLSAALDPAGYDHGRSLDYYERAVARLKSVPGVVDVTYASRPFLTGVNPQRTIRPQGSPDEKLAARGQFMSYACVLPGYLHFMGIPVISGRDFTADDNLPHPAVVIVNESLARLAWPGEDPLGKTVKLYGSETPVQVVGVVRDLRGTELHAAPAPFAFFPVAQSYQQGNVFHVRTAGNPADLLPTLRQELQALDPAVDILGSGTMDDILRNALWGQRTGVKLMSAFGLAALLLASLGLYAVMTQAVLQRTRELGIRIAIGAPADAVRRLILLRGALVTAIGLGAGLAVSYALTRYIRSFLFDIEPTDPLTFAAIAVVLGSVALLACYLPAHRAAKVDPIIALRAECADCTPICARSHLPRPHSRSLAGCSLGLGRW